MLAPMSCFELFLHPWCPTRPWTWIATKRAPPTAFFRTAFLFCFFSADAEAAKRGVSVPVPVGTEDFAFVFVIKLN
jgi:hypothetical protein